MNDSDILIEYFWKQKKQYIVNYIFQRPFIVDESFQKFIDFIDVCEGDIKFIILYRTSIKVFFDKIYVKYIED